MARRRRLRWIEGGALLIGLLFLGLWSRAHLREQAFQSLELERMANAPREIRAPLQEKPAPAAPQPSRAPAKPKHATRNVAALGRLEIPRLKIRAIVAEGADARTLDVAVGHIPATARPGSTGNCGLAGHRDTFFRGLGEVRNGDEVRFVTVDRTYRYQVEWSQVVAPDRVDTLDPTDVPTLTLVTCYPFTFVGRAPRRFVVRARQVDATDTPPVADARAASAASSPIAASR